MYTFVSNWTLTILPRHIDHRLVTVSSPFMSVAHFLLLIFPVAIFFCSLKYRCHSFQRIRTITLCCSFFPTGLFFVAEFSGCPIFRYPFFRLPFFCCPFFLPSYFSLLNFTVAQFSGSPIFRCLFSVALFTVAVFAVNRMNGRAPPYLSEH